MWKPVTVIALKRSNKTRHRARYFADKAAIDLKNQQLCLHCSVCQTIGTRQCNWCNDWILLQYYYYDECTFDCTVLYIIACEKLNDVTNVPILHAVLWEN